MYGILDKLKLQKRFCTLFSKLNQFTAWWIISNCDCTSWYVLSEVFTRTGTQKIVYWFEQVMTTIKNLLPKVYVGETKLYDKYEIMRICIIMQFMYSITLLFPVIIKCVFEINPETKVKFLIIFFAYREDNTALFTRVSK